MPKEKQVDLQATTQQLLPFCYKLKDEGATVESILVAMEICKYQLLIERCGGKQ